MKNNSSDNFKDRLQKIQNDEYNPNKKHKVLIVEDNPTIVKLYSAYLQDEFFIDVAYNGEDALKKITRTPPHLILLDIMMPGLSGFSVAQKMQDLKVFIPIIVITAKKLDSGEINLLKSLGIKSYFQKDDLSEELLKNEINKYIN